MGINNLIIGGLEDQVGAFVISAFKSYNLPVLGAPFGTNFLPPLKTNEPLFALFYNNIIQIADPILFSNLLSILSVVLTIFTAFILFRYLKLSKLISFILSLIFSLPPYTFLHIGIHFQLSQIWLIPLYIYFLFRIEERLIFAVLSGLCLAAAVLISNYIGFFLLILTFLFLINGTVYDLVIFRSLLRHNYRKIINLLTRYLALLFVFFVVALISISPYIKANYLGFGGLEVKNMIDSSAARSIEDFQNFSARPWYFVLPPLGNPWLGKTVTKPILEYLKNNWGYFLADDYFPKEHGGDFLGWANIVIFGTAVWYVAKQSFWKIKNQMSQPKAGPPLAEKIKTTSQNLKSFYTEYNLKLVITLIMTIVLLFLFTMPPFFTISGHKIYTLGFVLYKFFPMFRVTARIGVVILMCILIVNGLFLQKVLVQNQKSKVKSFLILYASFTLFEFYVPISTFDTSKVPQVYEYLSKMDEKVSFDFTGPNGNKGHYEGPLIIAEYPSGRSEDVFWITKHKKGLINSRMYQSLDYGYFADDFTKNLPTKKGLDIAYEYGVSYIVFHQKRGEKVSSEEFFRNNLEVEKEFPDSILFKLR